MKKKVLAGLIMAGMMSIPNVVQATERINVNRLYRQDICRTYNYVGGDFYSLLCKNLNGQNRTCSLMVINTYDIVKLLNKPFMFNNTNTCVSNYVVYPYTSMNMKESIFKYNDITKKANLEISKNNNKDVKENSEIEVKNQDKPQVNNKEVSVKEVNNDINKEATENKAVVSNSNLNKEENKNESLKPEVKSEVKPEVKKETTLNKKEEGKLTVAYKKAVNEKMVQLVNELRASKGAAPLKSIAVLNDLAEKRSEYMAKTGEFSHNDRNGNFIFKDDLNRVNYTWNFVGENIAQNYYSEDPNKLAEALFDQWKNSPGHYANMIKQDFNQIGFGIGIADDGKVYATQGFVGVR